MPLLYVKCNAPELSEESLIEAQLHEINEIAELATIAYEAKTTKTIPEELPSREYLNTVSALCEVLEGKSKHVAFHILWYVTELCIGRHPDIK